MYAILLLLGLALLQRQAQAFLAPQGRWVHPAHTHRQRGLALQAHTFGDLLSLALSETTVSEEEILDVVGKMDELPEPQLTISFAVFLLVGTAILQFSLGDLTKEEGQARVRDFLATKRETERKRGYFD